MLPNIIRIVNTCNIFRDFVVYKKNTHSIKFIFFKILYEHIHTRKFLKKC